MKYIYVMSWELLFLLLVNTCIYSNKTTCLYVNGFRKKSILTLVTSRPHHYSSSITFHHGLQLFTIPYSSLQFLIVLYSSLQFFTVRLKPY